MENKSVKKILSGILCLSIIGATTYVIVDQKTEKKEEVNNTHTVYSITSTKSIKMKNIGDTITINCVVKPDYATNKKVNWELSNSSVFEIIEETDEYITLKKIQNFSGSVTLTATTEDGGFTASCIIYSYNDVNEIVNVAIVDMKTHNTVEMLMPNQTYQLHIVYTATSDNIRDLDNDDVFDNYFASIEETLTNEFAWLIKDINGESTDVEDTKDSKYLFYEFITASDFGNNVTNQTYSISAPFGHLTAKFDFKAYVKVTGIDMDGSSFTI